MIMYGMYCHVWSCMVMYGHAWSGMVMHGQVWSNMVMYGHVIVIYGRVWPCIVMVLWNFRTTGNIGSIENIGNKWK